MTGLSSFWEIDRDISKDGKDGKDLGAFGVSSDDL
jgi:hypothetical protein